MLRYCHNDSSTSLSLIDRIQVRDAVAWERFAKLYTPLVYDWLRSARLQESDAADLVQEVFFAVSRGIDRFGIDGERRHFRAWLHGITRHKLQDHFRRLLSQPHVIGSGAAELPETIMPPGESTTAEVSQVAHRALQLIKTDFQPTTWQAFWRVTIEGQSPHDVAADLGMSIGAVYTAKSRVLSHLRRELDEFF